jgi:hypothetical protein
VRCDQCRWSQVVPADGRDRLECRANPPTVVPGSVSRGGTICAWPTVDPADWCREWTYTVPADRVDPEP